MTRTDWQPKAIALVLDLIASEYPEAAPEHEAKAEFKLGTLTLRCVASRPAIKKMADKFAHPDFAFWRDAHGNTGAVNRLLRRPSLRRPVDADALLAALEKELAE